MKCSQKLMRCMRCPTSYHAGDFCVAAGTMQVTQTDIICPKHYTPPVKQRKGVGSYHVNTSWCFVCSKGGSLICCDLCPSSLHLECLEPGHPSYAEGEKFYCEDCISGRKPLYNDLVWVKCGVYRSVHSDCES